MKNRLFYERGRFCTLIFLLPVICLATSCAFLQKREITKKREQWAAQKILDYRYTIEIFAFAQDAGKPVQIEVRGGKQVSLKCLKGELESPETFTRLDTIEKLFEAIEHDLNNDKYRVEAKYDETLGYPLYWRGDIKEFGVTDGTWKYTISNFEVIK